MAGRNYKVRGMATARKLRVTQQCGGDAHGYKPPKQVAYCPACRPIGQVTHPQKEVHVYLGSYNKGVTVRCKNGHSFVTA